MLLQEYAITPDVLVTAYHEHETIADLHLQHLKEALLTDGLVRDLCDGNWSKSIFKERASFHRRGVELLKKLREQNRLLISAKEAKEDPVSYQDWCKEALASHDNLNLRGIIATKTIADYFTQPGEKQIIGVIGRLTQIDWWQNRSCSIRLHRTTQDYINNLKLLLHNSNSLVFIDPHLDPERNSYREFIQLIAETTRGRKKPLIELHRVCREGSGPNSKVLSSSDWEARFRDAIADELRILGINIKVFIWDNFHDRYLISDLMGIQMSNGFDISSNFQELTTWSRLGRAVKDNVQSEFDEAYAKAQNLHALRGKFSIP